MSVEVRRLHASEYDLLKNVGDGFVPDPERSIAIAGDNGHHIVSRIFLVAPAHVEGVFIERPWRNGNLLKRMVDMVEIEARAEGLNRVLAYAVDDELAGYIGRLGYKRLPIQVFSKELLTCPQP